MHRLAEADSNTYFIYERYLVLELGDFPIPYNVKKIFPNSLWGQMGPNCQVESICGHIFVRHFHILIIYDHMIANGDTKKIINPNDLDWPWMTLKWHKKTFFSQHIPLSITFSAQNCLKMKNLLSYDFEQGTKEYIYKKSVQKVQKWIFFVKVEINICIFSSTARHVSPTKMTIT